MFYAELPVISDGLRTKKVRVVDVGFRLQT